MFKHANFTIIFFHLANRLTGVTVKASDSRPPIKNILDLERDDYLLCGSRTAETKPAEIVKITCKSGADGRYVYVYLPGTNFLTMCEVKLYGDGKSDGILFLELISSLEYDNNIFNSSTPGQHGRHLGRRHFQMPHFLKWKCIDFD